MAGINKVILVGRIGKDPEIRHLEGGSVVANFSLATSESYTDRRTQERITQTEWHNIVAWRGLAEFVDRYLSKGRLIYIEGKIKTRNWTDKEGVTKYTTEIVADIIQTLGPNPNAEPNVNTSNSNAKIISDDLGVKEDASDDKIIKDNLPF